MIGYVDKFDMFIRIPWKAPLRHKGWENTGIIRDEASGDGVTIIQYNQGSKEWK